MSEKLKQINLLQYPSEDGGYYVEGDVCGDKNHIGAYYRADAVDARLAELEAEIACLRVVDEFYQQACEAVPKDVPSEAVPLANAIKKMAAEIADLKQQVVDWKDYVAESDAQLATLQQTNKRLVEAAEIGKKWMEWWLTYTTCDCEYGHTCGKSERCAEVQQIAAALRQAKGEGE